MLGRSSLGAAKWAQPLGLWEIGTPSEADGHTPQRLGLVPTLWPHSQHLDLRWTCSWGWRLPSAQGCPLLPRATLADDTIIQAGAASVPCAAGEDPDRRRYLGPRLSVPLA